MKLERDPSGCAARETGRYGMHEPWLANGTNGAVPRSHDGKPWVYATDGRQLVCVPVEADDDDPDAVPGPLPVAALRDAFRGSRRAPTRGVLWANGDVRAQANPDLRHRRQTEHRPPDAGAIVRDYLPNDRRAVTVTLNASLLRELAKIVAASAVDPDAADGVQLTIGLDAQGKPDAGPMVVRAQGASGPIGREAFGLLMPIAGEDAKPRRKARRRS